MAEMDDLSKRIEQLEIENKLLTSQLRFAIKEINKCHKMLERYEKIIDDEVEHICKSAKDLKDYSDVVRQLYEKGE